MKTAEEAIQLYDNADDPHKAMTEIQSDAKHDGRLEGLREAAEIAGRDMNDGMFDVRKEIRDAILARVKELEVGK